MQQRRSMGLPQSQRSGRVFRNNRYGSSGSNSSSRSGRRNGQQYIDPAKFVNAATPIAEEVAYVPANQFDGFGFDNRVLASIKARNYGNPTPIQDQSIPHVLTGRDLIGLANTGTGKTAAFLLPILHKFLSGYNGQALIMVPTRELATQINDEFRAFAKGLPIYSAICVGGTNINPQIAALRRNPQIIIGTPGRLKDLMNQKYLHLGRAGILVLDEADRMLDMGFIKDIQFIIATLPQKRQSLCLSATMTPEIERLLQDILTDPITVSVRKRETSANINQDVIKAATKEEKITILEDLLRKDHFNKVLVFGATKFGVQRLADQLVKDGFKAEAIHGNKSQGQRQRALNSFKSNQVQILVATDVAARGLDIPMVSHVINFDQPNTYEEYVHRIGRTGRAGQAGHALTFVD